MLTIFPSVTLWAIKKGALPPTGNAPVFLHSAYILIIALSAGFCQAVIRIFTIFHERYFVALFHSIIKRFLFRGQVEDYSSVFNQLEYLDKLIFEPLVELHAVPSRASPVSYWALAAPAPVVLS
jgi:hypothetical protein